VTAPESVGKARLSLPHLRRRTPPKDRDETPENSIRRKSRDIARLTYSGAPDEPDIDYIINRISHFCFFQRFQNPGSPASIGRWIRRSM